MSPAKAIRHLQWFFSFLFVWGSVPLAFASNPDVIKASRNDVSPPLSHNQGTFLLWRMRGHF
jgi:hypothetical protein